MRASLSDARYAVYPLDPSLPAFHPTCPALDDGFIGESEALIESKRRAMTAPKVPRSAERGI